MAFLSFSAPGKTSSSSSLPVNGLSICKQDFFAGNRKLSLQKKAVTESRSSQRQFRFFEFTVSASAETKEIERPVIIGIGGDFSSGRGTMVKRIARVMGGENLDSDPSKSNTSVGEFITCIRLDDYHTLDRETRRKKEITPLNPIMNDFDLLLEHIEALKNLKPIKKPFYNHMTGKFGESELVQPNHVIVLEGLHPMLDPRIRELLDCSVLIEVSSEIKRDWKRRGAAAKGRTEEEVLSSLEQEKEDYQKYVHAQREFAHIMLQYLPSRLTTDSDWSTDIVDQVLRVRMLQRDDAPAGLCLPMYLIDEGSTLTWVPAAYRMEVKQPGILFRYGAEYGDLPLIFLEMDGNFEKLEDVLHVERFLKNMAARYYGEVTQHMIDTADLPGSTNGSALFSVMIGMKLREFWVKTANPRGLSLKDTLSPAFRSVFGVPPALINADADD